MSRKKKRVQQVCLWPTGVGGMYMDECHECHKEEELAGSSQNRGPQTYNIGTDVLN